MKSSSGIVRLSLALLSLTSASNATRSRGRIRGRGGVTNITAETAHGENLSRAYRFRRSPQGSISLFDHGLVRNSSSIFAAEPMTNPPCSSKLIVESDPIRLKYRSRIWVSGHGPSSARAGPCHPRGCRRLFHTPPTSSPALLVP